METSLRELVTSPVGQGRLERATNRAEGDNPVCGDRLAFELSVVDGVIVELAFRATACPACIAVASCAVLTMRGAPAPLASPIEGLRGEVQRRGGLTRFERHALALVEDVLIRAARGGTPTP